MTVTLDSTELPEHASPVVETQRIRSLDVLRGFALFGVLAMNMQAFADVFAVYMNPFAAGDISAVDYACWCVNHVLADMKFITIFSMLFGAGIILMTNRSKAKTGRSAGVHYRRMVWLMLFGVAHALLLFNGDILFIYGMVGLIAYWFCRLRPWTQMATAVILLMVPAAFLSMMDFMSGEDLQAMRDMWKPSADYTESIRVAMRGGFREQFAVRLEGWTEMFSFLVVFGWRVLACMLLGMAMFSLDVFSASRSKGFYTGLAVFGFGVGLPLSAWGIYDHQVHEWDMVRCMGVGSLFNYFGSLFAAFGWIGLIMLMCRADALPGLRARLSAVGRMAFTNYIMQSVLCTLIYNGHGLGQFGQVDRVWQQVLAIAIFAFQLWYSHWWLQRYRYGPLEWLWRSLTYWQQQPFRR